MSREIFHCINLKRHRLLALIFFIQCFVYNPINAQVVNQVSNLFGEKLYTDELGFIYIVNSDNQLMRYDSRMNLLDTYTNDRFGKISLVDVSNPLKILIFFKKYQLIILLDNTLSEMSRFDLHGFGYFDIQAVSLSNDNKIWLYDPSKYRLLKIEENGRILTESNSFFSERLEAIQPGFIYEFKNQVFLLDEKYGLIIYDNFGQFNMQIPELKNVQQIVHLDSEKLLVLKDNKLFEYSITFRVLNELPLPINLTEKIKSIASNGRNILIMNSKGVWKYRAF